MLIADHDLLLIDPRGTGRSHPIRCGATKVPATREGLIRACARCRLVLGRQARAYTGNQRLGDTGCLARIPPVPVG